MMECATIALNSQMRLSDNSMQFGYAEQCHLVKVVGMKIIVEYAFNYQY